MGEENPIPLHALGAGRAQVSHALIESLDFLRKNDETKVVKQKLMQAMGEFADDFSDFGRQPPTINGDKLNAQAKPQETSSAAEPKPENPYAKMTSTERCSRARSPKR
jgi:hypothetical protein